VTTHALNHAPKPDSGSLDADAARELIRREVDRENPSEGSRRAIELIVETALLTKAGDAGGEGLEDRIRSHLETLRREHPRLFERRDPTAGNAAPRGAAVHAEPIRVEPPPPGLDAVPPADAEAAPSPEEPGRPSPARQRDWLTLGSGGPNKTAPPRPARDLPAAGRPVAARPAAPPSQPVAPERVRPVPVPLPSEEDLPGPFPPDISRAGRLSFSGPSWLRPMTLAIVGLPLLIGGLLFAWLGTRTETPPGREAAVAERPMAERPASREPAATGGLRDGAVESRAVEAPTEPVRGIAEVLDTATLNVQGKVVRLFGVEWVRGAGDPDDLARYLRGREVACEPAGTTRTHRCEVGGQDLSRVVLFNGGGRATQDATPELRAAEEHAKSAKLGLWGDQRLIARP
jgi:hypothetical protein